MIERDFEEDYCLPGAAQTRRTNLHKYGIKEFREDVIRQLLKLVGHESTNIALSTMVDANGAFRKDAPWRLLLVQIESILYQNWWRFRVNPIPTEHKTTMLDYSIVAATLSRRLILSNP